MFSDPEHMRWYPEPFDRREGTQEWLDRQIAGYRDRGFALLIVEDRETGEFLGTAGPALLLVEGVEEVEIGWHTRPGRKGEGIAPEAGSGRAGLGVREPRGRPPDLARPAGEPVLGARGREDRHAGRPRGRPQGPSAPRVPDRSGHVGRNEAGEEHRDRALGAEVSRVRIDGARRLGGRADVAQQSRGRSLAGAPCVVVPRAGASDGDRDELAVLEPVQLLVVLVRFHHDVGRR